MAKPILEGSRISAVIPAAVGGHSGGALSSYSIYCQTLMRKICGRDAVCTGLRLFAMVTLACKTWSRGLANSIHAPDYDHRRRFKCCYHGVDGLVTVNSS